MTVQELLKLCNEDGKVFILGEDGQVKFVILGAGDYASLKNGGSGTKSTEPSTEDINRAITRAQMEAEKEYADSQKQNSFSQPVPIQSVLKNWHAPKVKQQVDAKDLAEVIDPSWDDEGLGFSV